MADHGTCPVCNGSTRVPPRESLRRYLPHIAGYDLSTDSLPCDNCGGQYMSLRAIGTVRLRADGTPCTHAYKETSTAEQAMYGDHRYLCTHCGDAYRIDSGD